MSEPGKEPTITGEPHPMDEFSPELFDIPEVGEIEEDTCDDGKEIDRLFQVFVKNLKEYKEYYQLAQEHNEAAQQAELQPRKTKEVIRATIKEQEEFKKNNLILANSSIAVFINALLEQDAAPQAFERLPEEDRVFVTPLLADQFNDQYYMGETLVAVYDKNRNIDPRLVIKRFKGFFGDIQ